MKYLNFKFLKYWLKYYFSKYSRYRHIYLTLLSLRPRTILEIGVYRGIRSYEMISLANDLNLSIKYYGFDLFEKISKKKINLELSKQPLPKKEIKEKLKSFKNTKVKLISGDTQITLKKFIKSKKKIDFIFIDGGHSIKTILSDWKNVKKIMSKKSIVIFDDYYDDTEIIKKYGCNKVINEIGDEFNFEILKSTDFIFFNKKKIKNYLVKVFHKN